MFEFSIALKLIDRALPGIDLMSGSTKRGATTIETQRERACLAAIVATLNGPLNPSVLALEIPVPDTVSHIRVRDLIIRPRLSTCYHQKGHRCSPQIFFHHRVSWKVADIYIYIYTRSIVNTTFRLRNSRVEYTGYTDLEIPDWRLNYRTMLR